MATPKMKPGPFKPVVLVVLDGWGIAPPSRGNAMSIAQLPVYDDLTKHYPTMTLQASGEAVGLPWGEMGNSEVGHLNMGSGRIIYQDLPRINKAIVEGTFFSTEAFVQAVDHVRAKGSKLHILGLLSSGGVHSFNEHAYALLELAKQSDVKDVFVHAILDGRDTPRESGVNFATKLQQKFKELKIGKLASISGRYYAMDRDNRWDRTEKAYDLMTKGVAERSGGDAKKLIVESYRAGNYDEEFLPTLLTDGGKPVALIEDGDAVIFFNYRPDRARQLTKAFVLPGFEKFPRKPYLKNLFFVTMTEYDKDLPVVVAFPPEYIEHPVARVISEAGLPQFHIAETEKYAHVTYFFNGGREDPFPGQENVLIPSPSVGTYDQTPEMSAREITERVVKEIRGQHFAFVIVNYANADMVGHTGNIQVTIKGLETLDECLGRIVAAAGEVDGTVFITADHGNAEEMLNLQTYQMDKEHSTNAVPFIAVRKDWKDQPQYMLGVEGNDLSVLQPVGILADVAATILEVMKLEKPPEMTGHALIQ